MSEKKETPILKTEHLTKMFPVKKRKLIEKQKYVHAAEDVSFEVYPGEVLGIVGESGSGKSTLARTILALTPSTSGQVFYQGEDITDFKVSAGEKRRLRSEIQMIFQDPYASLNPKIKIGNAIAEPMLLHGQASSYAEAKERSSTCWKSWDCSLRCSTDIPMSSQAVSGSVSASSGPWR